MSNGSSVFKNFDSGDIVAGKTQTFSYGTWSNGNISQNSFYISDSQVSNSGSNQYSIGNAAYYWDVYDQPNPDSNTSSEKYFSVYYGDVLGRGSGEFDVNVTKFFPTKAVYNQFKNLLLSPSDAKFSLPNGLNESVDLDNFYAISFFKDKYKDRLDAGQFEITISGPAGTVKLIDDSQYQLSSTGVRNKGVYNLVSGSIENGIYYPGTGNIYQAFGLLYPNVGTVILNPSALNTSTGLQLPITSPSTIESGLGSVGKRFSSNQGILLFGSSTATNNLSGYGIVSIKSRSSEFSSTRHLFVRVKNQEFNYSNNPSFVKSGSSAGQLKFDEFSSDPRVYITTVGLYDSNNELVSVAKLSQPLKKTFDDEALIKIALSW